MVEHVKGSIRTQVTISEQVREEDKNQTAGSVPGVEALPESCSCSTRQHRAVDGELSSNYDYTTTQRRTVQRAGRSTASTSPSWWMKHA